MMGDVYVLLAFVVVSLFVLWLEWRESGIIDASRAEAYRLVDRPCRGYLRMTKDRPLWRVAFVCASLITVAATVPYAACLSGRCGSLTLSAFCVLVFATSLVSAQSALSYYTWHLLCPHYTCSDCSLGSKAE